MKIIINEKQVAILTKFLVENKQKLNESEKANDESYVNKLVGYAEKVCMETPNLLDIKKTPNTEHDLEEGLKNFNVWTVTIRNENNPIEFTLKPESFIVKKYSLGSTQLGEEKGEKFIISPEFSKSVENRFNQIERTKNIKQKELENKKSEKEEFVNSIVGESL